MKLLIIEDNPQLLDAIAETLSKEKFVCETAATYSAAHEKIHLYQYDILVVDINLPDGSGLQIIREIKKVHPATGIIVVSARNSLDNKIEGLELGADDYITKPFDMAELVARVKSLIRRRNFGGNNFIELGKLRIDPEQRKVYANEKTIELTRSEYDILLFFSSNVGRVITRESLAEHIWGDNMDLADSFDFIYSHIKNLRKKITQNGLPDPIKAVYGVGYKFEIAEA
ncbi:MAG TPA: response regulator transcription factor [Bacteroidales bacterium]|nr:response regulator transcription factor [Prolixibacteraceae bacterium]HPG73439.1 response regulator transcription factor [Bacteroidales bacterium]